MQLMKTYLVVALTATLGLTACGGNSDSSGGSHNSDSHTDNGKKEKKPLKPSQPSNPSKPSKPSNPSKPSKPSNPSKPSKPSNPPKVSSQAQQWLDAHNRLRRKHQVGDLQWSDTLAKSAQAFVDTCPSGHSRSKYGENIAFASYKQTPENVLKRWYSEVSMHDFNNNSYQSGTGHFTQIVWKNTTRLGCAQASNCSGWSDIVVCQYDPAGNYYNRFTDNVFPAK